MASPKCQGIVDQKNSVMFWNHVVECSRRALCTETSEVNLSAFIYRLFHEDFSSIIGTMTELCLFDDWGEILMKQSVNKHR